MKLISIEGLDGAGKTTLIQSLIQILQNSNLSTYLSYEPGDEFGKIAKFGQHNISLDHTVYLWWIARRREQEKFRSLNVDFVFKDRYYDSTYVYQHLEETTLENHNFDEHYFQKPDLTIFLDLSPEVSLQRMGKITDRPEDLYETSNYQILEERRNRFKSLYQKHQNWRRIAIIDTTNLSPDQVVGYASHYLFRLTDNYLQFTDSEINND